MSIKNARCVSCSIVLPHFVFAAPWQIGLWHVPPKGTKCLHTTSILHLEIKPAKCATLNQIASLTLEAGLYNGITGQQSAEKGMSCADCSLATESGSDLLLLTDNLSLIAPEALRRGIDGGGEVELGG